MRDLGKRGDANQKLLHLGHRVGVTHAHVDVNRHLALEHIVGDLIHAELLELLGLLASDLQHRLVGLVMLLQQHQLPQDRRNEGLAVGHQHIVGQQVGRRLQQGHRPGRFPW